MQSAFEFKNGIRIIVFTTSSKICTKICNEKWEPIKDYASAVLLESEESYHRSIRAQHNTLDLIPEHSTKFEENRGCPFDEPNCFNPAMLPEEKGKYVSRSTFQRVSEENKKLLRDIKILTGDLSPERVMLGGYWKDKFRKDRELNEFIKEVLNINSQI